MPNKCSLNHRRKLRGSNAAGDSLKCASNEQEIDVGRRCTECPRRKKRTEANHEQASGAEKVAEAPSKNENQRERKGEERGVPLQLAACCSEAVTNSGQSHRCGAIYQHQDKLQRNDNSEDAVS